ncbi:Uu.00g033180.m01.CDS01 [Anthostomella pinea]|uniref:Uu.00g033180.m01.CDS01 n=1 Tax=Anthostomella pinea TaxID=933095 RepID=A0AAI8V8U2_9PEZI|nr:Uu.00g033180.m01.CDS01 [Anthostomella pinea]
MLRLILAVALTAACTALDLNEPPSQVPLGAASSSLNQHDTASSRRLNFSSAAPYLFSSVSSLLQQWGNTFFPNGHSIVACEIPPYTLFYHGRMDDEVPPSPEWLAFDIQMSYGIMGGSPNSHMLTYQTTRPVKALYFDGESAALMGLGQLDTQMLHVFGNVSGPNDSNRFRGLADEYARAHGLCDWLLETGLRGDGWGYEGVIRMNAAFEMIWCNFTSPSLRLLTHLNVTAPQLPQEYESESESEVQKMVFTETGTPNLGEGRETSYYSLPPTPTRTDSSTDPSRPPKPPNWRGGWERSREPFVGSQTWGWFSSATLHYGSSKNGPGLGEVRAKVLNCGIMSYYSPQFENLKRLRAEDERMSLNLTADGFWKGEGLSGNRTLALKDLLRRRRYHHLENATSDEAALMRTSSERALRGLLEGDNDCSGADWGLMINEITQTTTLQLHEMTIAISSFPNHAHNQSTLQFWMSSVRSQSHMFLVSFLEFPATKDLSVWDIGSDLFQETYARCRYRYTRLMAPSEDVALSPEEVDLRWVVEETFGAICSVLLTIGFGIERSWATHFQKPSTKKSLEIHATTSASVNNHFAHLATSWSSGIEELMAWLGWADESTGCSEVCAWNERCYIPMWPLIQLGGGRPRRPPGNGTYPHPPGDFYPPPYRPGGNHTGDGPPPPPPGGRPSFSFGEADLWEPKCINASYFTNGW